MSQQTKYVQAKPFLFEEDHEAVAAVLRSLHLEDGQTVRDFEAQISDLYDKPYTCATVNGFSAIHLALLALNVGPGDEVVLPAYTCPALIYPIKLTGATAVFADIGDNSFNMTRETVEAVRSTRTKAVLWPHMFGFPADMTRLGSLRRKVIEDVAQAMGGSFGGRRLGTFTDMAVSSFYATKNITAGDGGALSLSSERLHRKVSDLRYYGSKLQLGSGQYYNYKMGNLNAALGLSQLARIDELISWRRQIASWYDAHLERYSGTLHTAFLHKDSSCYQKYPILFPSQRIREQFRDALRSEGVNCGYGVLEGLHRIKGAGIASSLRNTNKYLRQVLCLPVYPGLRESDVAEIMKRFDKVYKKII
jgi:perosamine synthetase